MAESPKTPSATNQHKWPRPTVEPQPQSVVAPPAATALAPGTAKTQASNSLLKLRLRR